MRILCKKENDLKKANQFSYHPNNTPSFAIGLGNGKVIHEIGRGKAETKIATKRVRLKFHSLVFDQN